jgi:hypothetical protein
MATNPNSALSDFSRGTLGPYICSELDEAGETLIRRSGRTAVPSSSRVIPTWLSCGDSTFGSVPFLTHAASRTAFSAASYGFFRYQDLHR